MDSLLRLLWCLVVYVLATYVGYRIGVRDGKEKLLEQFEELAKKETGDEQST